MVDTRVDIKWLDTSGEHIPTILVLMVIGHKCIYDSEQHHGYRLQIFRIYYSSLSLLLLSLSFSYLYLSQIIHCGVICYNFSIFLLIIPSTVNIFNIAQVIFLSLCSKFTL